jgi:GDSL-like lipase/acylhydrolase family protein
VVDNKQEGIWHKEKGMRKIEKVLSMALLCILWGNLTCAGSAEKAWIKLVGQKCAKQSEFAFVKNDSSLPNILIYGDSISMGYTRWARKKLKGKANVYRLYCNGGPSSWLIERMSKMHTVMQNAKLDRPWTFQWDVIHFNVGLHDLKYLSSKGKVDKKNGKQLSSINTYKKNLHAIVTYLKKLSPNAKLIFATTTPVPEGERKRTVGDAEKYNAAALDVLRNYPAITINDLYGFTKPNHAKWWAKPGNVHYNRDGKKAQGNEVARIILQALYKKDKSNKKPKATR